MDDALRCLRDGVVNGRSAPFVLVQDSSDVLGGPALAAKVRCHAEGIFIVLLNHFHVDVLKLPLHVAPVMPSASGVRSCPLWVPAALQLPLQGCQGRQKPGAGAEHGRDR